MMGLTDLLACILATWQLVDTWFKGSLFRETRETMRTELAMPTTSTWRRWWLELQLCWYCYSHHVAVFVVVPYLVLDLLPAPWLYLARIPVYVLAVIRGVTLAQSLLPADLQYDPPPEFGDVYPSDPSCPGYSVAHDVEAHPLDPDGDPAACDADRQVSE
jgi:hypothetical protein